MEEMHTGWNILATLPPPLPSIPFPLYLFKNLYSAVILGNCWEVLKLVISLTRIFVLYYFPIMLFE